MTIIPFNRPFEQQWSRVSVRLFSYLTSIDVNIYFRNECDVDIEQSNLSNYGRRIMRKRFICSRQTRIDAQRAPCNNWMTDGGFRLLLRSQLGDRRVLFKTVSRHQINHRAQAKLVQDSCVRIKKLWLHPLDLDLKYLSSLPPSLLRYSNGNFHKLRTISLSILKVVSKVEESDPVIRRRITVSLRRRIIKSPIYLRPFFTTSWNRVVNTVASFWDTIRAATDNELLAVCRVGICSARSATRNPSFCLELDRQATLAM